MSDVDETSATSAQAEAIAEASDQIRRRLAERMDVLKEDAQRLLDWRCHVQAHPWTAAAFGYLMAPRRVQVVRPDEQTLESLQSLRAGEADGTSRPGPLGAALQTVGDFALQSAIVFVARRFVAAVAPQWASYESEAEEVEDGSDI